MRTHALGRTGLSVSQLAFGGAAVGQQYGPVSVAEVSDALYAAADAGVNLIDTSAFYGLGKSEEILGEVLTPELRKQFHICTKAGRHDRAKFDFTAKGMRDCFEGSLRRLKTDHVEILLAHDIEFADDAEARLAFQDQVVAPVLMRLDLADPADAADGIKRRVLARPLRLDHRDPPIAGERIAGERAVARLEDMQRQREAGKQDRPR